MGLHRRQCLILFRGLELLRVGGRLVYSTCSFNPLEDEAVIASALEHCGGSVELRGLPELPGLDGLPGLNSWVAAHPEDGSVTWEALADVPDEVRGRFLSSHFPPTPGSTAASTWAKSCKLCRRFLPHRVQGGGFFVAVLEKIRELPAPLSNAGRVVPRTPLVGDLAGVTVTHEPPEHPSTESVPDIVREETSSPNCPEREDGDEVNAGMVIQDAQKMLKASSGTRRNTRFRKLCAATDYAPVEVEDPAWLAASSFFGFDAQVARRFCAHCDGKRLYRVSDSARRFLSAQSSRQLKVYSAGIRVMECLNSPAGATRRFRFVQDGIRSLVALGIKRRFEVSPRVLQRLLQEQSIPISDLRNGFQDGEVQSSLSMLGQDGSPVQCGPVLVTLLPDVKSPWTSDLAVSALLAVDRLESYVTKSVGMALSDTFQLRARAAAILNDTATSTDA
uniref:SAM-dependent MTase RsmB/NOP-type domain-containing protein n=1 Tax=Noctiluca scintillans TaxID=2966 RepID=A0A7S0ZSW8_NOCSC